MFSPCYSNDLLSVWVFCNFTVMFLGLGLLCLFYMEIIVILNLRNYIFLNFLVMISLNITSSTLTFLLFYLPKLLLDIFWIFLFYFPYLNLFCSFHLFSLSALFWIISLNIFQFSNSFFTYV